ncbi:phosphopantetheine-binding protein [Streptomyces fumanus]|uniref:Carrier domain-containing protein n=1 Tax=Streptomyces fumanus TaxID=67302 RepID=A0A919E0H5_9ACTN|nr:phosphopantetheine-binding protein [Streptomyces fumanus]GHE97492.1 hypothetical protein GCM10018772_22150 [Streptomyces fumanus]
MDGGALHEEFIARDELGMSGPYVEPRSETERRLAALWAQHLAVAPVGVEDDFFELGGDSLLAAEVQVAIDTEFGVEIEAAAVFLAPTVAALAEAVRRAPDTAGADG